MLDRLLGKWDYIYLFLCAVLSAEPVIFAVTCFHQQHTWCLPLCYAKVFDLATQLVMWRWRWNVWHVHFSVFQYLVTGEMVRLARMSFIIIHYRMDYKSDNCSVNLMTLLWLLVGLHPAKHKVVLSLLSKVGIITQLCVSPATNLLNSLPIKK